MKSKIALIFVIIIAILLLVSSSTLLLATSLSMGLGYDFGNVLPEEEARPIVTTQCGEKIIARAREIEAGPTRYSMQLRDVGNNYDCSSFVSRVYRSTEPPFMTPGTSSPSTIMIASNPSAYGLVKIPTDQRLAGDILLFYLEEVNGQIRVKKPHEFGHAAIFVENVQGKPGKIRIIDASSDHLDKGVGVLTREFDEDKIFGVYRSKTCYISATPTPTARIITEKTLINF